MNSVSLTAINKKLFLKKKKKRQRIRSWNYCV